MDDGETTLKIGGAALSGWTSVSITRSIERMPASFDISLTEKYPGDAAKLVVQPGDTCVVMIGGDVVITGFVDRFQPSITARDHTIRVIGRSKSCDLVDCSAEWPGGQISGSSALDIVTKLAKPYPGLGVKGAVDTGPVIPQFNLTLGETGYAIAERICRYRGLLIYDDTDGTILLNQAGKDKHASGLIQGTNVESVEAVYSMDERFSTYDAFLQAMDTLQDIGDGGNLLATVTDPGVKRHRQKDIIAEAGGGGLEVCKARAQWEANRRVGRSFQIVASVDSWRDSAGTLWTPNFFIPLQLPALKLIKADYLIGEVTYVRDSQGTHANMLIMPKGAFLPEPILLQPFAADVPAQGQQ